MLRRAHPDVTTRRILKVNHAGETGAIKIYTAQIAVARRFFPQVVAELDQMRLDEIEHCRLFREAMPARNARPCRIMSLWSLGGYVLGVTTALFGERMVWICTEAVESTVHRHLEDQLRFLKMRDPDLHSLIASIQDQELAHLRDAQEHQISRDGYFRAVPIWTIGFLTDAMIWLSTWGDSTWMRVEIEAAS
jgi:ubiquinone biosynthesis monooxygenase Coq7